MPRLRRNHAPRRPRRPPTKQTENHQHRAQPPSFSHALSTTRKPNRLPNGGSPPPPLAVNTPDPPSARADGGPGESPRSPGPALGTTPDAHFRGRMKPRDKKTTN